MDKTTSAKEAPTMSTLLEMPIASRPHKVKQSAVLGAIRPGWDVLVINTGSTNKLSIPKSTFKKYCRSVASPKLKATVAKKLDKFVLFKNKKISNRPQSKNPIAVLNCIGANEG